MVVPLANNGGPPTKSAAGDGTPVNSDRQTISPTWAEPASMTISCPPRIAFREPKPPAAISAAVKPTASSAVKYRSFRRAFLPTISASVLPHEYEAS